MTAAAPLFDQRRAKLLKNLLMYGFLFALLALMMFEPAFATGTGTTTGTGGAAAAQTRITNVALGWQNIVMGVGVAILVIAWSVIGYAIAFNGKTMKDMQGPAIGTTVAGLAPVLVGWLFS
ncbi:hypothetical protein EIP75_21560 [Aquabacterium soli]|uniref:Uncharacterized protein n=1 Tax=Aquabacterium soli TaxID=2493092 RepID=A0A426V2T5_9BURK|nr:TrbC/VirB2 family protein [Aquabacterium soli]RRS01165.1 hypothetical protein EIP75_21560 [Aquabacterium soli]